ncbi:Uncharacterized membrane protein YgdD, TMEM256/DUF423 family [Maribacter sedimenticola]|uniref:Uncharacterized membrane protein YgdD, TMEM256/DUF423 family n=1 Tax=Maribacter sedimenticola TaxID=228956 RepID=A0ABY1SIK0_9FLAO|nr:DUF423 domain-containing protein [Maribacter sedimenticola]SNR56013.1 Uncharacterized membrane protein YgdD, TMEM256/DUF423 family [Maribacter sedimenticola]
MKKTILSTACVFGLLAVVFGAFGAHGLKNLVGTEAVTTFETGVRYQMYHAFFLFVLGLMPENILFKKSIYISTLIGVVLFSFSIYLLSLNDVVDYDFRSIGFLTPIGGVFLIAGWGLLGYSILRSNTGKKQYGVE